MHRKTLSVGTLVGGRYRVLREAGRGGMGVVYAVEHVNTGGQFALKVMLDGTSMLGDRAERFRREARVSSRVTSDHVVKVTDADTAPELDGAPYLVMELLDGIDLEKTLEARGRLESKETIDILDQVARGLGRAHGVGVVHRDLKPENIFLHRRDDGTSIVKLLDFGISKMLGRSSDMNLASMTSPTDVMGTPLYMAPEQASARHGDVGPPTDVWAVGLVAVRMLTGGHYWTAHGLTDLLAQILDGARTPPSAKFPHLTHAFDAWFRKSCAFNPDHRFQTVRDQVTELGDVLLRANANASPNGGAVDLRASAVPAGANSTVPIGGSDRPSAAASGDASPARPSLSPAARGRAFRSASEPEGIALGSSTGGRSYDTPVQKPARYAVRIAAYLGLAAFVAAAVTAIVLVQSPDATDKRADEPSQSSAATRPTLSAPTTAPPEFSTATAAAATLTIPTPTAASKEAPAAAEVHGGAKAIVAVGLADAGIPAAAMNGASRDAGTRLPPAPNAKGLSSAGPVDPFETQR